MTATKPSHFYNQRALEDTVRIVDDAQPAGFRTIYRADMTATDTEYVEPEAPAEDAPKGKGKGKAPEA